MKTLYLIRHAKSSKDIPGIKDQDRPLNKRGKIQIEFIGKHLGHSGIVAQAVYSSPAKRALDTAGGIAKKMGFPRSGIKVQPALYASSVFKLLKMVKGFSEQAESVMIFGHNPEFLQLVNYLTLGNITKFPTCGVFGIDFNIHTWRKVVRGKGRLIFSAAPLKRK